jgi:predicted RNA-binding Zn-ribbon protein involved in translation (DUF1610 family)
VVRGQKRENRRIAMSDLVKDKSHAADLARSDKTRKRVSTENCEICGQKLERDPESGEYYCPDCDNPEK